MKNKEHEHIHTLQITKAGEKQLFQIKLPKNAKKITGILVTVQAINNTPPPSDTPGIPVVFPKPIKEPVKIATPGVINVAAEKAAVKTDTSNNTNTTSNAQPIFPLEQVIP